MQASIFENISVMGPFPASAAERGCRIQAGMPFNERWRRAARQQPNQGLNAGQHSQARVRHAACGSPGKRHASHAPASLQSEVSRSVPSPGHAPGDGETNFESGCRLWRVPGPVTKRTGIAETRHQRQPPHGRNQNRIVSPPRHQNAFPLHPPKKRSRVAAPGRTVFNSPRARPLSPALRSELQTDRHWKMQRSCAAFPLGGWLRSLRSFRRSAKRFTLETLRSPTANLPTKALWTTLERDSKFPANEVWRDESSCSHSASCSGRRIKPPGNDAGTGSSLARFKVMSCNAGSNILRMKLCTAANYFAPLAQAKSRSSSAVS